MVTGEKSGVMDEPAMICVSPSKLGSVLPESTWRRFLRGIFDMSLVQPDRRKNIEKTFRMLQKF